MGSRKKREKERDIAHHQFTLHLRKVEDVLENKEVEGVDVARNTIYLFQGGNVSRHDKVTPFLETQMEEGADEDEEKKQEEKHHYTVFQPAKRKKQNALFTFIDPTTQQPVSIGIEICREHSFGVLKEKIQ